MTAEQSELNTVDYAVFEFPGNKFNGEIAPTILDAVSRGLIRILDLAFVKKDADGSITALEITEMDAEEVGSLSIFAEDAAGLLSEEDIVAAGEILQPESSAMFVVWENTWAAPIAAAIRESGGVLAATGRIQAEDLRAAL